MCTRFVYNGKDTIIGFNFDIDLSVWTHKIIKEKNRFYIGIKMPDSSYHSFHGVNKNGNVGTLLYVNGNEKGKYSNAPKCRTISELTESFIKVGLISVLACVYCTFFLSAKCKDTLTVLLIAIGIVLIPTFAYTALGVNWISAIFPSAGLGMQNNFLYQLINFNYLHIGGMSFWTPYTILISALIEIPVFLFLTVRTYCRHQM